MLLQEREIYSTDPELFQTMGTDFCHSTLSSQTYLDWSKATVRSMVNAELGAREVQSITCCLDMPLDGFDHLIGFEKLRVRTRHKLFYFFGQRFEIPHCSFNSIN